MDVSFASSRDPGQVLSSGKDRATKVKDIPANDHKERKDGTRVLD